MDILSIFRTPKITQEDLDREIKVMKAEQKYKRMYVLPPPTIMWAEPILDKKGFVKRMGTIQTNQKDIERWKREHYDWLPDKV